MRKLSLVVTFTLAACGRKAPVESAAAVPTPDSAFAAMQTRGEAAMGVDQYTSSHVFEPLPDGGRISLQRDRNDPKGAAKIRDHLTEVGLEFKTGNFSVPGFVHDQVVPGTKEMSARRTTIDYSLENLPHGAALRLRSTDSIAVRAIHEFLVFQRTEHHAPDHAHSD